MTISNLTNEEKNSSNEGACENSYEITVPPEQMRLYSVDRDPASESDIEAYVHGQAQDETVHHVEKIKTEHVLGDKYEIWDVITDKNRWWVITNLTNLYLREHFPSLDYTLSFHVGLMMRLRSRTSGASDTEPHPFDEVFRRLDQANERQIEAIEVEDHQAIGMQLREALVSLSDATRRTTAVTTLEEIPKGSDFVGWMNLLLDEICSGSSNKPLRQFLKRMSKETWQLVNWLTHHRNANSSSSSISVESCGVLVGHMAQLLVPSDVSEDRVCPECASRHIRSHFDITIGEDGEYFTTCGKCGWSNHPSAGVD